MSQINKNRSPNNDIKTQPFEYLIMGGVVAH